MKDDSDMDEVQAALHVSENGVTFYANRAMLRKLIERLTILVESPEDEFYEIHYPEEFYRDLSMFENDVNKNVLVHLSERVDELFRGLPDFVDTDGEILSPMYGLTIMHHKKPSNA